MPVFFVAIFMIYLQKERLILAMTINIEDNNLFYRKVLEANCKTVPITKRLKNFFY